MVIAITVVAILVAIFGLGAWLFSLMPAIPAVAGATIGASFREIVSWGLCFIPARCWQTFITTIVVFGVLQFSWAIIVWIYQKIPGIN